MHAGLAVALDEARDPEVRAVVLTGDRARLLRRPGPRRAPGGCVRRRRPAARAAESQRARDPRAREAGARRGERPRRGSRALARTRVRCADRGRLGRLRAGLLRASASHRMPGTTWLAVRLLGAGRAFEWLATGHHLSAAEALQWGLVSEVVPDDDLPASRRGGGAALCDDADTRSLGDEAPARRGADRDARGAARARGAAPRASSSRRPTSTRAWRRSWRSASRCSAASPPSGSTRCRWSSTTTCSAGASPSSCAGCSRSRI